MGACSEQKILDASLSNSQLLDLFEYTGIKAFVTWIEKGDDMRIEGQPPHGMPPSGQPNPSYYNMAGMAIELIQISHMSGNEGDAENLAKEMHFNCPPAMRDAVHGFLRAPSEESLNNVLAFAPHVKGVLMAASDIGTLQQALDLGDKNMIAQTQNQLSSSLSSVRNDLPNLNPQQQNSMKAFLDTTDTLSKQTSIAPEDVKGLHQQAAEALVSLGVQNARDFFGL